jgi:pimeloyl-ACP methyl ester carboxylesterase
MNGPVVLCGHSYGGAVISAAGDHPNVGHLVYLCAFALDAGESLAVNPAPAGPVALAPQIDGSNLVVDPDGARDAFYGDCAEQPVDRLVPHPLDAFTSPVEVAAWRSTPSTYVLCTQDRAIHPDQQRFFADRCSSVVELPASHSPMLSMPDRVAQILRQAATD